MAKLVSPEVWEVIELVQPFHGGKLAHTHPLAILQWLSNVDKHRAVHIIGSVIVDTGPMLVQSPTPLQVIEDWHVDGPVEDGMVVARLKVKRPPGGRMNIGVQPFFARDISIRISEAPEEFRTVSSLMEVINDIVLKTLAALTTQLGLPPPDVDSFELGKEHMSVAAEFGRNP